MPERAPRRPAPSDTTVASPCRRRSCLDDSGTCLGCLRTLAEITAWSGSSDSAKHRILDRAAQRQKQRNEVEPGTPAT